MEVPGMLNVNGVVMVHCGMPEDESAYAGQDTEPSSDGVTIISWREVGPCRLMGRGYRELHEMTACSAVVIRPAEYKTYNVLSAGEGGFGDILQVHSSILMVSKRKTSYDTEPERVVHVIRMTSLVGGFSIDASFPRTMRLSGGS
jgi:hypothetical protein